MLWQLAYTEIFFLDKLWPDFTKKDLKKIINKFKKKNTTNYHLPNNHVITPQQLKKKISVVV
jgi:hypothetical protein